MPAPSYTITCLWDDEARVWYVAETDVPGLAAEASTLEEMERKLRVIIPELLELNVPGFAQPVPYELVARKQSTLRKTA